MHVTRRLIAGGQKYARPNPRLILVSVPYLYVTCSPTPVPNGAGASVVVQGDFYSTLYTCLNEEVLIFLELYRVFRLLL